MFAHSRRVLALASLCVVLPMAARAQSRSTAESLPPFLRDRGTGIATSMFGTYVMSREWLVYPFYEYTLQNKEYKPGELGYGLNEDFFGRYYENESLLFLAYGVSDRLALEVEGVLNTRATLHKSSRDPSALPSTLTESGLGDVQSEARYRWAFESARRPEVFSYFETTFPFQRNRLLIGTQDWEFKFGTGVTKGFAFGTVTVRAAAEYLRDERKLDYGEYAVEYLKRMSNS